jgi:hypothetical protein
LRPGTFTFTVLRDPVARVVSLYRYLADDRADQGEVFTAPANERQWAVDGFTSFLDRIDEPSLLNQLYMFSPTLDPIEAAGRIRACSRYFFTEFFNEGVAALALALDVSLPLRVDRVSVSKARPTAAEVGRLRTMLGREYQLLDLLRRDPGDSLVGRVPPG